MGRRAPTTQTTETTEPTEASEPRALEHPEDDAPRGWRGGAVVAAVLGLEVVFVLADWVVRIIASMRTVGSGNQPGAMPSWRLDSGFLVWASLLTTGIVGATFWAARLLWQRSRPGVQTPSRPSSGTLWTAMVVTCVLPILADVNLHHRPKGPWEALFDLAVVLLLLFAVNFLSSLVGEHARSDAEGEASVAR